MLRLYPGPRETVWRLVAVSYPHGERTSVTVEQGALPFPVRGRRGFLTDLARIVWELRRRWVIQQVPEGPREPLGGGGGDVPLPGIGWPSEAVPLPERCLDKTLADSYNPNARPAP